MGKAGRWLRSFLVGKKDGGGRRGEKQQHGGGGGGGGDATPAVEVVVVASPREKKRWSFRRSSASAAAMGKPASATSPSTPEPSVSGLASVSERARDVELEEQSKHAMAVAVETAAAGQAAAEVMRLAAEDAEVAAAVRIQATYRGYLARKALCALRGLVKLQALIRGNLVRKQATATLRRMQALLVAQARLRAQRMRMLEEEDDDVHGHGHHPSHRRSSPHHPRHRRSYEMDRSGEEHAKIVEVDVGEPAPRRGRSSCSVAASESRERRMAEYGYYAQCSPAPSSSATAAFTELAAASPPRDASYGGHFDDFPPFEPATARSSPYVPPSPAAAAGGEFFPNYMANTQSSRAKARSQSAPRQRTEPHLPPPLPHLERQPSRRRGGVPRSVKMQRSSSHVGVPAAAAAAHGYHHHLYNYNYGQYPWSVKLDRSSASLKDSECGSTTSSVLTAATTVGYCRSLVGFDLHKGHY
uniref:DUF4005 domain-containing protein n=1 Tax=Oryza punctata TaxID=4537 RepID=A0A0E0M7S6_ORYPU